MLQGIFNYDNPVWRFIGKLGDLMILNLLWIICSIPIFTIGASTTAVYYVTMKLVRGDDGYTFRNYFKSFKENFKQATAIWLLMLVTGIILGFDLYFFLRVLAGNSMVKTVLTAAIGALTLIWLCTFSYVFPLQCRFYNPVKRTLFNAFFMSIRHFFHTLGMLVLDGLLLVMGFFSIYYMPQFTVLAIMFGFPLIAFINSYILNPIFNKYIPEEENHEDPNVLRPILEDVIMENPETKKELQETKTEITETETTETKTTETEQN